MFSIQATWLPTSCNSSFRIQPLWHLRCHLYPGAQVHLHIIKNSKSFVLLVLKEAGQGKTLTLSLAKVSFTLMTLLPVLVGMGVTGVYLACVLLRIEPRALCMPAEVLLTDLHSGPCHPLFLMPVRPYNHRVGSSLASTPCCPQLSSASPSFSVFVVYNL